MQFYQLGGNATFQSLRDFSLDIEKGCGLGGCDEEGLIQSFDEEVAGGSIQGFL